MINKGQGALEYLILIGAAVLIATVVIYFLVGGVTSQKCQTAKAQWEVQCNQIMLEDQCNGNMGDIYDDGTATYAGNECEWDSTNKKCVLKAGVLPPECS